MSLYRVYITPRVYHEIRRLPGHIRHRIKRAIDDLEADPYPPGSRELEVPPDLGVPVFRLRLDNWRVVYAVTEIDRVVDVLAVHKRPPYDYGDLAQLLTDLD